MEKRFALLVSLIVMIAVLVPIAGQPIIEKTQAGPSPLSSPSDPPKAEFNVPLYVNGFDDIKTGWTRAGASPYLDAVDYMANCVYQTAAGASIGDFFFEDVASYDGGKIYLEIFASSKGPGDDRVEVWLFNETISDYNIIGTTVLPDKTWSWKSVGEVSSALSTTSRINDAKAYIVKVSAGLEDQVLIDAMRLVPEQKSSDFRPTAYSTDLVVTAPTQAYDGNIGTRASFVYSSVGGTQTGLELYNFASPLLYTIYNKAPFPSITNVDFHMRYNTSLNTGNLNDKYQIVYYVSPSVTPQVLTPLRTDNATYLYVNGFDNTEIGWTRVGSSPYLGSVDYPTNYVNQSLIIPIIRPDGNGFYNTWTIGGSSPAPTRWESVDEATSDSDITYVYVAASNSKQTFTLSNPPAATWGIGKIRLTAVAKQVGVGADEKLRLILRIGGTDYNGTFLYSPTTYSEPISSEWDTNPATGNAWQWADITSLEAGLWSEQYGAWAGEMRVTQMFVEIIPEEKIGDFNFQDLAFAYEGGRVFIEIYAVQDTPPPGDELDSIEVYMYNPISADYFLVDTLTPTNSSSWVPSIDFSSNLTSTSQINAAKVYLLKRTNGEPNNVVIDSMRIKVHNPGYVYETSTLNWANAPEPNDGTWDWTDVQNIRFAVETQVVTGTSDHGCEFGEFEAWVTVTSPKSTLKMPNVKNPTLTPQSLTIRPNADNPTYRTWSDFPANSIHYEDVDEAAQNGDLDYIYATATAQRDLFDLQNPAAQAWTIGSVRLVAYAKYSVAADEKLFGLLFLPGLPVPTAAPYTSSKFYTLTTDYAMYSWDWGLNPYTLEPWSWSDLTNLQAGVQTQVTGSWTGQVRVTQLYVQVLGPRVWVDIRAENVENFWGYSMYLSYDTSILTATVTDYDHSLIRPDADGASTQWTIGGTTPAATRWQSVNEALTDRGVTYIVAAATNLKNTFSLQDVSAADWLIGSVELTVVASQTGGGNERFRSILVIGGTTYNGSLFTPTSSYNKLACNWTANPATGNAWTFADINGLQAGVWSEAQGAWTGTILVTQLFVTVKGHFIDATPFSINDVAGYASFGYNMPLGTAFGTSGNITFGRVLFVPDALGWSPLGLYNTRLTDSKAGVIPHLGLSAIFENSPGAAPVVDVAVSSVTPSAMLAFEGYSRDVSVDVTNQGTGAATFDVTSFYNGSSMGTQTVVGLGTGLTTTLTFTWDTTGVPYGNYTISAYATKLTYETDFVDNSLQAGNEMMLTIPGDVTGDKTVNVFDILKLKYHRSGPPPGPGGYLRDVDINDDGFINVFDILIAKAHLGQSW